MNGVTGATRITSETAFARALGLAGEQLPLLGVAGEQPQRVGELRLGRVDAADEHVEDQVSQLGVIEAVVAVARRDQGREQVVAGLGPLLARRARRGTRRAPRRRARPRRGARRASGRRTGAGSTATTRRAARRPRSARRPRWRSSSPGRAASAPRPRRTRRAATASNSSAMNSRITGRQRSAALRGERRVDQVAQAAVIVAVDVEDVARDLLAERALLHLEQLRERLAGEGRLLRAQEELARLALEDHVGRSGRGRASSPRRAPPCGCRMPVRAGSGRARRSRAGPGLRGRSASAQETIATTRAGAPLAPTIRNGKQATLKPSSGSAPRLTSRSICE